MKLWLCLLFPYLSLPPVWGQDHQPLPAPLPTANATLIQALKLALDAVFGMGIRLQAFLLDDSNENFIVSPISAAVTIGELMLGAEGEFRQQLVELLQLPNDQLYENGKVNHYGKDKNISYSLPYSNLHLQLASLLRHLENDGSKQLFTLKQKSAAFVQNSLLFKNDFVHNMRRFYGARVHKVDFVGQPVQAQKTINGWASRHTNGLIRTILPQPPPSTTASIFANAIYFLADWEIPFSDILNRRGPFNVSPTKQVEVTYMIGFLEQILYSESKDYRMIALPYRNEELGMYIILPKLETVDIKTFMKDLKASELLETMKQARRREVVVKIPKMTVSNTFSILDQLKKYRVYKKQVVVSVNKTASPADKLETKVDAFSNFTTDEEKEIYLTNAADRPLHIGDIVQQVVVTVNEKGTEAAAVTATTIDYIGGSKNFVIDRPFAFFIRHEATSATLFWGTISNPSRS